MFDEMPPEHFHQFISSSRHPSTLNFPPHQYPSNYYNNNHQFLLHHHNKNVNHKQLAHDDDYHQRQLLSSGNNLEQDIIIRSADHDIDERSSDLWSNEEVLELLRIRSNMDQINWFPHHFTWNHVSRKLAELGFKKSPENCKEKFEEESQHFSNNIANTKHYRFFSELEEICHGDQNPPVADEEDDDIIDNAQQQEDINIQINLEKRKRSKKKKRFEKLKEFIEEIVNKMMSQQEHLNNKLIQDMLKRDEENVAKEEAWKSREIERINKETESRAQERAISKERQDKIIEFINKFIITSNSRNPNHEAAASSSSTGTLLFEKDDSTGKRWPRDEVIALINLRSNHYRDEKAGLARGPLWERISKGMMELGYNRSGKRCKEKWENINKYYRKTKDGNKKRSVDSRTCPYFHQLSTLYNHPENHSLSDNYHHDNGDDNGNVLHCDHDDKGD